jgi:hypothetical protein
MRLLAQDPVLWVVPVRIIFFNTQYPSEDKNTIADQARDKREWREEQHGKTRQG